MVSNRRITSHLTTITRLDSRCLAQYPRGTRKRPVTAAITKLIHARFASLLAASPMATVCADGDVSSEAANLVQRRQSILDTHRLDSPTGIP